MIAKFSLIAVIAGGACLAAESQIEGPKLGFVYDRQAAAVRPILGIPGSALFGAPLQSQLRDAVVSPLQDFAIGVFGDDSTVGLLNLSEAKLHVLKGAKAAPTRIVLSPNGTSAAIVNGSHVQVFSGLPANAEAGVEFDLTADPSALAVSDDGVLVLAAIAESDATALYSYSGGVHRILTAGQIRSIEFLNRSHDAVFADALENKIILLRNSSDATLVASVDGPTAVAASIDNRKIIAASSSSRSITTISLDDGTSVSTACGCKPVTLARLQGDAVFRITELSDGPAWIFDGGGPEPRVLFIPQAGGGNE
jgi:hypothetical protein